MALFYPGTEEAITSTKWKEVSDNSIHEANWEDADTFTDTMHSVFCEDATLGCTLDI